MRVEVGYYLGVSIDRLSTCYGRERDGSIQLCVFPTVHRLHLLLNIQLD